MYQYGLSNAYVELVIFMIIINAFLIVKLRLTDGYGLDEKLIVRLIYTGSLCAIFDILCVVLEKQLNRTTFYFDNAAFYLTYAIVLFMMMHYTLGNYIQMGISNKIVNIVLAVPLAMIVILLFCSFWTGWAIKVDEGCVYSRGPLFVFFCILCFFYIAGNVVAAVDFLIKMRSRGNEAIFPLFYCIPLLLGPLCQLIYPKVPTISMGLTLSFLCILMNYQELQIRRSHNTVRLLGALCENYDSIHIVDLDEEALYTLRNPSGIIESLDDLDDNSYQHNIERIVNKYVTSEERKEMLNFLDIRAMKKRVKKRKHFSYRFTILPNESDNYSYEMQCATVSDSHNHNLMVLGTKCIDDILKLEREEGQYSTALLHDCSYFYDFDVTTGLIDGDFTTRENCDPMYGLNIDIPATYDEFNSIRATELGFVAVTYKESTYWTCEGLKAAYKKGKRVVEIRHKSTQLAKCWNAIIILTEEPGSHHLHAIYICKDVTEMVMSEEKFKQELKEALKEARRANAAKSSFLSKMSHDIRTPLNGIIGLLEISERHADDVELLANNRKKAKVAANHLLSLINDVLDMSKLEDDKTELINEPFNLHDLCSEVLTICDIRAKENGISITDDDGANLRYPNVYGSALHLKQVLMNIINNAIKYNKPNGHIFFGIKIVECDGKKVVYEFVISDTGIGMSEEYLMHIFEPFTQERSDARSRYQGTGLGMAIVKALVDKMDGTIAVESTLGEGTKFTIEIPFNIDYQDYKDERLVINKDASVQGMRILLVEDNELNLEIAQCLLQEAGATVDIAENGEEACQKFEESRAGTYDVILMDIMMPLLDGYGASQRIRQMKKSDALTIPIIAMSANAFAEDVANAKASGMNEHLAKPIDVDRLLQVLVKYRNV